MMSSDPDALTFVVEDSFCIRDRGIVLTPTFETNRFASGTRLTVTISLAPGESKTVQGRFLIEHTRLEGGGSKWHGVVVLDEGAHRIEPGTEVTCVRAAPEGK
jgi:hypothetical protein